MWHIYCREGRGAPLLPTVSRGARHGLGAARSTPDDPNSECVARSKTWLGSRTFYPDTLRSSAPFTGMLSSNSSINPPFHSWNLVRLIYCDGGGFAGATGRLNVGGGTVLYLDGGESCGLSWRI
ncbi:hypothetical protein CLOM_g17654 [Closterium sp. NIES-68]|nr:hypothetical protein CLOM_g17654 [Closterium sp. NIES-68]